MDELKYEICTYWFNEDDRQPKNLPCGHCYCSSCLANEISVGRNTCPTCRTPHNAKTIADLPVSVIVERMIRNMPKKLVMESNSSDSEEDDDDYSGSPCSKHKKSITYFHCLTHSLPICRECTVINHPVGKCEVISFEDQVMKKKDEDINQASLTREGLDKTLASLDDLIKEKQRNIKKQKLKIENCKKTIEEASKIIIEDETANEDIKREVANGKIKGKNIDAAKSRLKNANSQKSIKRCSADVRSSQTIIDKWIKETQSKFELVHVHKKIPTEPTLFFIELKLGDTVKGRVLIRLDSKLIKIREYMVAIVTGQEGKSLAGIKLNKYSTFLHQNILPFKDITFIPDSTVTTIGNRGDVVGLFRGGYLQCIYFQTGTHDYLSSEYKIIGSVVGGMDILQECYDNHSQGVKISKSGLEPE